MSWRPIESLESRILFDAFQVSVNFQPANVPTPAGYVADTGALYGDRGNGYTYGWTGKLPAITREQLAPKQSRNGPDVTYDTFAILNPKGRGSEWQIAVPNGEYKVQIVAGSPIVFPAVYRVEVDDQLVLNGRATQKNQWVTASGEITVVNGMLSITTMRGIIDRLDSVQITAVSPTSPPPPVPPPSPPSPPPPAPLTAPLTWQTLQTSGMNEPPAVAEAQSVVANGELFVFGGYDVTTPDYQPTNAAETFDPNTNTWSAIAPMPAPATHMGVATDGTYIYIAGGYTFDPVTTYQTFATTNVFQYDIATNTWANYVPLPAGQARGAGTLVYLDGELHFIDGVDVTRTGQKEHWVLNPSDSNPQWTNSTDMPETANHTSAVVLNGKIVVVGGQTTKDDNSTIADVWEWDPSNPGQWTSLAPMQANGSQSRRSHAVVDVYDDRIIVAGGLTITGTPLGSVIVYDPDTNSWSDQASLPDGGRLAAVGGIIGNKIIVALGYGDGSLQNQTWEATAT